MPTVRLNQKGKMVITYENGDTFTADIEGPTNVSGGWGLPKSRFAEATFIIFNGTYTAHKPVEPTEVGYIHRSKDGTRAWIRSDVAGTYPWFRFKGKRPTKGFDCTTAHTWDEIWDL